MSELRSPDADHDEKPERLYHIVKGEELSDTDFRSNNELIEMGMKPRRRVPPTPEQSRLYDAPSAYDSLDKVRQLAKALPRLGTHVATLDPSRIEGLLLEESDPEGDPGHYLMWGERDSIASGEIWPRLSLKE